MHFNESLVSLCCHTLWRSDKPLEAKPSPQEQCSSLIESILRKVTHSLVHNQVIRGSPSSFITATGFSSLDAPSSIYHRLVSAGPGRGDASHLHSLSSAAWCRSPPHGAADTSVQAAYSSHRLSITASTWAGAGLPLLLLSSWADAELTIRKVTRSSCPNQQHSQWLLPLKLSLGNSCQAQAGL